MSDTSPLTLARDAVGLAEKATAGGWDVQHAREPGGQPLPYIDGLDGDVCDCFGRDTNTSKLFAFRNADANAALIAHAGTHYATIATAYIQAVEELERVRALLGGAVDYATAVCRSEGMPHGSRPVRVTCDMYREDGINIEKIAVFEVKEALAVLKDTTHEG